MRLFCVFLIFWFSLLLLPVRGWGQYIVDFEGATKGSYESGTVNLSGLDWDLTEVLIGTSAADWKNGARSARMRGYGTSSMTMLDDKPNGLGTISFQYRRYGTDTQVDWKVEYSTNGGANWTQVGNDFTAPASDIVQTFSETIDIPGNIRVRIKRATETGTANRRLNIDDIVITDYKFEVIDFDDDNKWTAGSGALNSYQNDHSYEDQGWLFTGGEAMRQNTATQDGFPGALGAYAWRLRDGNDVHPDPVDWRAMYDSRGIIEAIGFDVRRWDNDPNPNWSVEYSTDGGDNFSTAIVTINNDFLDNSSDWKTVYHIFPEPLQVNEGEFVLRFLRNSGERIMVDNFAYKLQSCSGAEVDFRAVVSGSWYEASNWEVFDGTEWVPSFCIPDANANSVQIDHFIEISTDVSLSNVTIKNGGQLSVRTNQMKLSGNQAIVIEPGGIMSFETGSNVPEFQNNATVIIMENGIIRVNSAISGISGNLAGNNSSGRFLYEDGSIFEWNNNSLFQVSGQTYFPDAPENIFPIFSITSNISGPLGGGSDFIVNGLFIANGDISFSGTGQSIFRNGVSGLGNITQAANSGVFIINGSTATIGGSGQLILNDNGLEIASELAELISDKTISGTGPLILDGNLNAGSHTLSLGGDFFITGDGEFVSGTSTLVLNGTEPQTFQAPDETDFYHLKLKNPGDLLLESPVNVLNTLELSQGNIINENTTVTLGISPEEPGELLSAEGFIKGIFSRYIPAEADTEWFFPIGRNQHEAPVKILFTSPPETGGILETEYITVIPDNFYGNLPIHDDDLIIDILFDAGFWRIQALQGLNNGVYNVSLGISDTLQERIFDVDEVRILKRETHESDWAIAGSFGGADFEFITHINVETGFSEFAVGSDRDLNPLPIELLYFNAEVVDKRVNLFWATASEINNDFFTLERTTNMREIEIIGRKPGAGNSNTVLRYSYTDRNPHPGISYYRLKQTDYDGSYEYSDWVAVRVNPDAGNELEILRLFQQDGSVFILLQTQLRSNLEIRVSDIYGRDIHHGRLHSASETASYSFVPNTSGLIFITISDGQKRVSGRLVIR